MAYWVSLAAAIAGNFVIAVSLIPALLTLKTFQLFIVVITLGISFGLLFELLIRTMEHLEAKHHLLFATVIPIIALASFAAIAAFSNSLEETMNLQNPHSPLTVGAVYAVAFMIPYAAYHVSKRH